MTRERLIRSQPLMNPAILTSPMYAYNWMLHTYQGLCFGPSEACSETRANKDKNAYISHINSTYKSNLRAGHWLSDSTFCLLVFRTLTQIGFLNISPIFVFHHLWYIVDRFLLSLWAFERSSTRHSFGFRIFKRWRAFHWRYDLAQ